MDFSVRNPSGLWQRPSARSISPKRLFALILFAALIAFEAFNFSTTNYALQDLLGNLTFLGVPWATILALAFCGIDFAGIASLFSAEPRSDDRQATWYLFGAWMLAATMNAALTWWGVSMAVVTHSVRSVAILDATTLVKVVPVFVALLVWLIRILIIGSLSYKGAQLWDSQIPGPVTSRAQGEEHPARAAASARPAETFRSMAQAPRPNGHPAPAQRPETTYAPLEGADVSARMH